jgi:hypothetical protein
MPVAERVLVAEGARRPAQFEENSKNPNNKKAPGDAGAFELRSSRDQYLAAIGAPPQLKR